MSRRAMVALLAWLAFAAAPAEAAWFAPATLDGPSPDVVQFGDVDVARDGTGAAVWLRMDAGAPHVFLSRLTRGAWSAPERVDTGLVQAASDPVVAVADKGRLVVAWSTGNQAYGAHAEGFGVTAPEPLGGPGPGPLALAPGQVRAVDADMAIQGTGFVVFESAGDIRAARLLNGRWQRVGAPLDIAAARAADSPRVALGADGNALVTWREAGSVFARRVTRLVPSMVPLLVSLEGGPAAAPDVTVEDDGSYAWVAFRQEFNGVQTALARRLVGSQFEPPAAPLAAGGAALSPRISINGKGVGLAAVPRGDQVDFARLERDVFAPPVRAGGAATLALAASAVNQDAVVAWAGPDGMRGRRLRRGERVADPEAALGGPVIGERAAIGASRAGDFAVGYMTGGQAGHSVVVAPFDFPPRPARLRTTRTYQPATRPLLRWKPGTELWGPQRFSVLVDGREVGTTTRPPFRPPTELASGAHTWTVRSVDMRGQTAVAPERPVLVDAVPPVVSVRVTGRRRAGSALRIVVDAVDRETGVRSIRVDFGDKSPKTSSRDVLHRYSSPGRRRLGVRVEDAAGNVTNRFIPLRIR